MTLQLMLVDESSPADVAVVVPRLMGLYMLFQVTFLRERLIAVFAFKQLSCVVRLLMTFAIPLACEFLSAVWAHQGVPVDHFLYGFLTSRVQ